MSQAIHTRYFGPTNTRGSRVKAYSEAFPRGISVPWDYALNSEENHMAAAKNFATVKGWDGVWVAGGAADGKGNVYVRIDAFDSVTRQCAAQLVAKSGRYFNGFTVETE